MKMKKIKENASQSSTFSFLNQKCIISDSNDNQEELNNNIECQDIQVGDIIHLRKDEVAPVDMILLDTNEIKDRKAITYIDTNQVDGNQQLVRKEATNVTQSKVSLTLLGRGGSHQSSASKPLNHESALVADQLVSATSTRAFSLG